MRDRRTGFYLIISFVLMLIMSWGMPGMVPCAWSDEDKKKKDLPPRRISIALEHPGVIIPQGDDVSIDLNVTNGGRQDENIMLSIASVPKGWKAQVKTYSFRINSVHVKSDKSKTLTFKAEADEDIAPGDYTFLIHAKTEDGGFKSSSKVIITVEKKEKEKKTKGIDITTSYPVLRGPTDAKFEFSIEVENKLDKDTLFNLSAQGPKDWEINFKPAYEDKFISSLRIKKDGSQTMAVEVKPNPWSEAGSYPVLVKVSSEDAKAEVNLKVVLTGTYKLEAGTADGLLSLNAYQGKPANISFYVKNNGSASHNTVKFLSFKPENWKVEFNPERLENLAPGDLKQIEMTITPADQALVGDYSVSLRVEGEKATKDMEFRVTVRASTVWGWIGIGIIVVVIIGLVILFIRLGRR